MRPNHLPPHRVRGFTLIEMVVVIALIGIMAAVIIPEMKGTFDDALLRSSGRELVNTFNLASSQAIAFGRLYRVRFDSPGDRFVVERQVRDGALEDFVPLKDVPGAEDQWDSRISVEINASSAASPEDDSNIHPAVEAAPDSISFYPDGTADAAEIRLRDRAGYELLLQLNPVTARVRVSVPSQE